MWYHQRSLANVWAIHLNTGIPWGLWYNIKNFKVIHYLLGMWPLWRNMATVFSWLPCVSWKHIYTIHACTRSSMGITWPSYQPFHSPPPPDSFLHQLIHTVTPQKVSSVWPPVSALPYMEVLLTRETKVYNNSHYTRKGKRPAATKNQT